MERRVGHGHAADEHRFQARHGCDRTGAPDLDLDGENLGGHLFGGKLVRDREPRRPRHETQALLLREIVDLVHDAVDLVGQPVALLANAPIVGEHPVEPADHRTLARHRQPQLGEEIHHGGLRRGWPPARAPIDLADTICDEGGPARCRHLRIELP